MILRVRPDVAQVIDIHSAAGRRFDAGGVRSFVREQGDGPAVVLLHGVPASSFLYRKVIPRLADQGLRAIAFDFPGLGLADRPRDFDYSWSGLARWLGEAIDALGLDRCHLVVHDIGGPIGCEWAVAQPRPGALADRAQHGPRARRRSAGRGRCARSRSAGSASSGCGRPRGRRSRRCSACRGSATARRCRRRRSTPTASCCCASTAAAPSCGSCAASSSPRRRGPAAGDGLAERPYPARIIWGELDPALGLDHMERRPAGARRRRSGAAARQALPPGGPAGPARVHDRRPGRPAGLSAASAVVLDPVEGRRRSRVELGGVELDRRAGARRAARRRGRCRRDAARAALEHVAAVFAVVGDEVQVVALGLESLGVIGEAEADDGALRRRGTRTRADRRRPRRAAGMAGAGAAPSGRGRARTRRRCAAHSSNT